MRRPAHEEELTQSAIQHVADAVTQRLIWGLVLAPKVPEGGHASRYLHFVAGRRQPHLHGRHSHRSSR